MAALVVSRVHSDDHSLSKLCHWREGGGILDGLYIGGKKEQPKGCSQGKWGPSHMQW